MNQFSRNLMLWAAIVLAMVMLFNMFQQPQSSAQKVSYTDFINRVDGGQINSVEIQGNTLIGRGPDGASVQTYAPRDNELVSRLLDKKVEVKAQPPEEQPWYMTLLVSWFPMLLLIGVWIFFMRQMQGGAGRAMSFGRSRARMLNQEQGKVTFDDVAGVDEAKEEAARIIQRANEEAELSKNEETLSENDMTDEESDLEPEEMNVDEEGETEDGTDESGI